MNNKWIPWVIGVLVTIAIAVSGYGVGRIDSVNADLQTYKVMIAREALGLAKEQVTIQKEYVLKEDFKDTIDGLRKQLGRMDDKLDILMKDQKRK